MKARSFYRAGIGLVVGLVVVLLGLLLAREHSRAANLEAHRARLCERQLISLESLARSKRVDDLHDQVEHHFFDQALSEFCLGAEIPLDEDTARTCWVFTDRGDTCYVESVVRLRDLYKERWGSAPR